jgi:outer membrane lipoprotein-sorting protein
MQKLPVRLMVAVAVAVLCASSAASAQTADEVIEKSLAAVGGRAALAKIKSRHGTGTIVLGTPAGDIHGTVETWNAPPNKSRTVIKADLTALGAGSLTLDQRFDGSAGYVLDTLQGNRDMPSSQVDAMRNQSFPHPFLNYKDLGIGAKLTGKEKAGDREAFVIVFDPPTGNEIRNYIDAQTFLPIKVVTTVHVEQLGQDVEQTTEFLDYKEIDGLKIPFQFRSSSNIQNITVTVSKVEHNVPVDDAMFAKPAK